MRATQSSRRKQRSKSPRFIKNKERMVKAMPMPFEIVEEIKLSELDLSVIRADVENDFVEIEEPRILDLIQAEASFIFACDKASNFIEEEESFLAAALGEDEMLHDSVDISTISGLKLFTAKNEGSNPILQAIECEGEADSLIQYSLDDTTLSEMSITSAQGVVPLDAGVEETLEQASVDLSTISGVKLFAAKNEGSNPILQAIECAGEADSLIQHTLDETTLSEVSLTSVQDIVPLAAGVDEKVNRKKKSYTVPGYLKGTYSSAKKRRSKSPSKRARIFRCA